MVSRAQLSQERSRQRRDQLLTAAISLFAEGGSRAVTHRAVARRAGLAPATTTYYFDTIEDLLQQALREHLSRWRSDLESLTGPVDREVLGSDLSSVVAAVFALRGPEVAALELSIYLAATRDPALREEAAETLRMFEQVAADWLSAVGIKAPGRLASGVVALVVGTSLRRQSGVYGEVEEAMMLAASLRDLVGAHLVGREQIDRALSSGALTGLGSRA